MGLHNSVTAVAVPDGVHQRFDAYEIPGFLDILNDGLTAGLLGEAGIFAGLGLHDAVFVDNLDELEVMVLSKSPVVMVMAGSDLKGTRAELTIDIAVRDNRNMAAADGHNSGFSDQIPVAFIVGVHADSGIARDGFGTGRGDDHGLIAVSQVITDLPEAALDVSVFNFVISKGRMAAGTPVDDVFAAVDEPVAVQLDKNLAHGTGKAFVHGEAQARPVHGAAHGINLVEDAVAVFLAPGPYALDKFLSSQILTALAFLGQGTFHDILGGDAGMIRSRHPEHIAPLLAVMAAERVNERQIEGMTYMQGTGDVRRGNDNRIRIAWGIRIGCEGFFVPPMLAPFRLDAMGIVPLGQLF